MMAKIEKKQKEGYTTTKPSDDDTIVQAKINLDKLPTNLCPNKPISQSQLPEKIEDNPLTYGQRKHNGHCIILVKGKKVEKVYTRRMEDITEYVIGIPVIADAMYKLPLQSFVLHEAVFYHNTLKKEVPRFVAQIIRVQDETEALSRYADLSKIGKFSMIPFDALFLDGRFIGDMDYIARYCLLEKHGIQPPEIIKDWKGQLDYAKNNNWEGFVLRIPGPKSHVSYTMDGKAHRAGSWKYKFVKEGDFFVDEVLKGKSGKHAKFYAKFHVGQYDDKGFAIDRGYVGCGTLSHEELAQLTKDIDSQKRKLPFVVEIEYQSIHDDTGKLEFGQIQRIREDKTPEECISDD